MKKIIILLSLFIPTVKAEIQLAFLKIYKSDGRLLQLETKGSFAHVAISVDGGWLHSHPERGVEIVSSLDHIGFKNYEVVRLTHRSKTKGITKRDFNHYYGLPYDKEFSWSDDKIYCSELIAKILKIDPTPMNFSPELWGKNHHSRGKLGISPDEIFQEALKMKFKRK